jgi:hypothetical protein
MQLSRYLKLQFNDLIDSYKKLLFRTSGITIIYTILCFLIASLLLWFSDISSVIHNRPMSMLNFFMYYHSSDIYKVIDLSPLFLLFFVSIFSVSAFIPEIKDDGEHDIRLIGSLKNLKFINVLYMLGILVVSCFIDYSLYKLSAVLSDTMNNRNFYKWAYHVLEFLRVYLPWTLFSICIYWQTESIRTKLTGKKILFLLISLWFINSFCMEFIYFIKPHVIDFILFPFQYETRFLFESMIGLFIIASFFVGYASVMANSLKYFDRKE